MSVKQVIKRKVAMAWLRSDDAQGNPSVHSVKYRRLDGSIGYKKRVSKSFKNLPGESGFRGNLNTNNEFLLVNHEKANQPFRIKIDLLIEVDGHIIDHTNGEYAATR
ncbi:hypothetical protein DYBT9275_00927 [Dyadobacter sp. CECT 9275]|uniref:Uncharacterized protein n=1 Tax=Dyadobacter helix TaxID=2822344 RepID=A0A916J8V8_9BACT|nr:hypothetical protein [Dyadobacter sp. CECT 9275]CAG4992266.1 hypothetical protein DYBT9275_00927 [Dyadobacter sp. CECT 9275]